MKETTYRYHLGLGIVEDLKQRIPYYLSDFFDGFVGEKTLQVASVVAVFVVLSLSSLLLLFDVKLC